MLNNGIVIGIGLMILLGGIAIALITKKRALALLSVVGVIVTIVGMSYHFVPSGYVGVRTAYGQISEKPVKSGLNWHVPFIERIHNINCKQQEIVYTGQIWSETSERTEVYCENVVIDYQINGEFASWIWTNVEEWDTNLVKVTSIESGIKAATKQFDDINVTDRAKIEGTAKEAVQKALNDKYGNQIVNIISVTIGNINFSDAYNEAIEKKAQAKLAAETAEYVNQQQTAQIEAEAEQKRIQAQAEADARKIRAEGEAEALRIAAEAEAEANQKLAESLTPELIEREKIEKWDGRLPVISGGSDLLIDASTLLGAIEEAE